MVSPNNTATANGAVESSGWDVLVAGRAAIPVPGFWFDVRLRTFLVCYKKCDLVVLFGGANSNQGWPISSLKYSFMRLELQIELCTNKRSAPCRRKSQTRTSEQQRRSSPAAEAPEEARKIQKDQANRLQTNMWIHRKISFCKENNKSPQVNLV